MPQVIQFSACYEQLHAALDVLPWLGWPGMKKTSFRPGELAAELRRVQTLQANAQLIRQLNMSIVERKCVYRCVYANAGFNYSNCCILPCFALQSLQLHPKHVWLISICCVWFAFRCCVLFVQRFSLEI